jgi:pyruvate dehydrogenase E1 component beta subunit
MISEEAFDHLDAPVKRICALDTPIPYSPILEGKMIPQDYDIITAVKEIVR